MGKRFAAGWEHRRDERDALIEAFDRAIRAPATVLEIGAGTGQDAAYFASHLPSIMWIASEVDDGLVDSIGEWRAEAALPNLRKPLLLDTRSGDWGAPVVSAIVAIDFVVAAPWPAVVGLFGGATKTLFPGGDVLLTGKIADEKKAEVEKLAKSRGFEMAGERDLGGAGKLLIFRLRG